MECEMCGASVGTRRHDVDGTVMNLGACCAKYGVALDAPPTQKGSQANVTQNLERRAARSQRKDIYQEETWDLVDDYGKRIRQAIQKKGISKEALGGKVHARVPELNKFESQQLRPSDEVAKALERELGITLMEKVDNSTPAVGGVNQGGKPKAMTLGDMIKDQLEKKNK